MGWPEKLRAMIKSQARFAARAKKRAQEYDSEEMALVDEECAAVSQLASSISHDEMPQRTATLQVSFFFSFCLFFRNYADTHTTTTTTTTTTTIV